VTWTSRSEVAHGAPRTEPLLHGEPELRMLAFKRHGLAFQCHIAPFPPPPPSLTLVQAGRALSVARPSLRLSVSVPAELRAPPSFSSRRLFKLLPVRRSNKSMG
jgi:hypothetical protein